jgi:hypothetical protein
MKDYRLLLLEFLDRQTDWTGNVFPLVEEYLTDTKKTIRHSYYSNIILPLEEKKYIAISSDSIQALSNHQNGKYHSDNITVRMIFDGHDHLEELRKKNSPNLHPVFMTTDEDLDHAILNFFRVKNDFALLDEMYANLRGNGFKVDVWNVAPLIKNSCFDEKYEKDSPVHYKINSVGRAMFLRLDEKLRSEKKEGITYIVQGDNKGVIGGDNKGSITGHIGRDQKVSSGEKKNYTKEFIIGVLVLIAGTIVLKYFHVI